MGRDEELGKCSGPKQINDYCSSRYLISYHHGYVGFFDRGEMADPIAILSQGFGTRSKDQRAQADTAHSHPLARCRVCW